MRDGYYTPRILSAVRRSGSGDMRQQNRLSVLRQSIVHASTVVNIAGPDEEGNGREILGHII
jgi:hypothetical protein